MALTYDQMTAITEKFFVPKIIDNIFNSHPVYQKLRAKQKYQNGGEKVIVPLEYAETTAAGWYQGAETLDTTENEVITAAAFDWKQAYANISITRREELQNSGDAQVVSLLGTKSKNAEKTLAHILSQGLYNSGTNSKAIVGSKVFLNASNTYGGISQSTYSWWQGNDNTTTTTLTIAAMQGMWGDCGAGTDYPDLLTGDQDMFDRYYALLQPQQRFQSEEMAKGGFRSLMFNGAPIVVDPDQNAGDLSFFNTEYLDLYVHPEEDMRFEPMQKPTDQNVKLGKIYWMGALCSSNNRRHGLLDAIAA
jgi:hypothetical protein